MVSWSYNHCHVHHWVCYKGVCRNVPNPYAVVTLFEASGYCGFWWYFIRKLWSVDHIIIVMFIIKYAIRGSAEMSQIHTQWSHFSTAVGYCGFWWYFIWKLWSVDPIIIVMFIIECEGFCRNVPNPHAVVTLCGRWRWKGGPKVFPKKNLKFTVHTQYSHFLDLNGFPRREEFLE